MQFSLPEIPVKIRLGVTEEERSEPQEVFITFLWQCDTTKVQESDDINDTVDYFVLREWTMHWGKGKSFATIEKCLFHFHKEVQKQFPRMEDVHVSLTKIPDGEFVVTVEM
jgi:FolB domain-containing protein